MLRHLFTIICLFTSYLSISQFTEISTEEEIFIIQEGCLWGNGASFYDYNHDGWDDLTTADGSDFVRFYENTGDGHFQTSTINLNIAFTGQIVGVLWLDIENDGDEDLLITQNMGRVLLFVNDGNFNYTECAVASGLPSQSYFHFGISAADYDNDGFIDFTIAKYYNPTIQGGFEYTSRLYHNDGDGTFTDVTATSGLLATPKNNIYVQFSRLQ
ncbi:MAG: VCBS repeat-containing protein [Flavobacteriales bacterium]